MDYSVIVPTYNRPHELGICLESLAYVNYPQSNFEVIVVDDGSTELVDSVVQSFQQRLNIRCIYQQNAGPAAARNMGAQAANGDIVAFTDDDCRVDKEWLNALTTCFRQHSDRAVAGKTQNVLPDNLYAATSQLVLEHAYDYYNVDEQDARFFGAANVAFPREEFLALGGYDPRFRTSEDRELADRWIMHGHLITYTADALIYHAHDLTLRGFCRQHLEYGRGAFIFHTLRKERGAPPFEPDYQFHWQIFKRALRVDCFPRMISLISLLGIFEVANLVGFYQAKRIHSRGHV